MYEVTRAYHDHMQGDKRRVLARVTIDYTDPRVDQGTQIAVSEQARISWPSQTADGLSTIPYMWASLDGSWLAGDMRRLMPDTERLATRYQVGWWGRQLAGVDGAFAAPYPTLVATHTARAIHSIRVVGEPIRGEYPTAFRIRLRDSEGVLLREEVVTDNRQLAWSMILPSPIPNVASQELEIRRWSHPGRQAKVVEFFASIQQAYESDELVSIRVLEEREISQGSLPAGNISANEILVRISNENRRFDPDNDESPLYGLIKPRRRIRAWLGAEIGEAIEWVPMGTYWATEWDTPSDGLEATVRGLDRMEQLRTSTYNYSDVWQDMTAYALAEEILRDAGLSPDEYSIDETLYDVVLPWAWMPVVSHREALRLVAEASMAVAYCDREGRVAVLRPAIRVETGLDTYYMQGAPFAIEQEAPAGIYGIGPDDYYTLRAPTQQSQVANEIAVTVQPRSPGAAEEVYRSSAPIVVPAHSGVIVTAPYSDAPVIEAAAMLEDPPAGVTISSVSYYAWGAEIAISNAGAVGVEVTLVIEGRPLIVSGAEQIIARDSVSIDAIGLIRHEVPANHLIQTAGQAQAIAEALLESASTPRRDVELDWRGNPALELGDVVSVMTDMDRGRQSAYTIIRQEIEWAGALGARLTGRRIT